MLARHMWRTAVSWGAWAGPAPLQGVFSTTDEPTGRDGNGAAWRRFVSQLCVHKRGTSTVLMLFKYFNASHLVPYFYEVESSLRHAHEQMTLYEYKYKE